jgi:hypothetical protein
MQILPTNAEGPWIFMFVMFFLFFVIPVLYCHLFCHVWCHFVVVFSSGAGSRIRSRLASTRVIFLYFVCLFFLGHFCAIVFLLFFFSISQIGTHFLRFVLHFPSQTWQWNDNTNPKWQTWMKKRTNKWQHIYFTFSIVCRPNIFLMVNAWLKIILQSRWWSTKNDQL